MNNSTPIQGRERMFVQSCLESAPAGIAPERFPRFVGNGANGNAHPQLYQLKQKLLRSALEETVDAALSKHLCGAANEASEQAWETAYPLLMFPCLFEEMAQAVQTGLQERQPQCSDTELSPAFEKIDPGFEGVHPDFQRSNPFSSIKTLPALFTSTFYRRRYDKTVSE